MKKIGYDGSNAIYETGGRQIHIPADTHDDDIELAIVHALVDDLITPMTVSEARALLERDSADDLLNILLDDILPFLEQRGMNRSARLNNLLNRRVGIRTRYPDGQSLAVPRRVRS